MTKPKSPHPDAPAGSDPPPAEAGGGAIAGAPVAELARRAEAELAAVDRELAEIDLLIQQARTEAARHETRRAQGSEKLEAAKGDPKESADLAAQLVTLTKRATVMESQVEALEGKRGSLGRYRDSLASWSEALKGLAGDSGVASAAAAPSPGAGGEAAAEGEAVIPAEQVIEPGARAAELPPAISRVVLNAQEDLRREIARAMHDGPAQSLTNIVLQAQIVDRLLDRDPKLAKHELGLLVGMVQQTLEATKSFIFDVRPMVLDDLGLVPTLRRAARDRGRRAGLAVAFDSVGADRRLGVDVESGLFRIADEALAAYLEKGPDGLSMRLDWAERLRLEIAASRKAPKIAPEDAAAPAPGKDVLPALAAMIEDRRAQAKAAAPGIVELPAEAWREIQGRARSIGASAELLDGGSRLVVEAPLPEDGDRA